MTLRARRLLLTAKMYTRRQLWHINCKWRGRHFQETIRFVFAALSTAARADTWTYTFSGTNSAPGGDGLSVAFQYSTQAPVTTNTSLFSWQLVSCINCMMSSIVPAVVFQPSNVYGSSVDFGDLKNNGSAYMFPFGSFSTPGRYISTSPFNPGTLTVQVYS